MSNAPSAATPKEQEVPAQCLPPQRQSLPPQKHLDADRPVQRAAPSKGWTYLDDEIAFDLERENGLR